MGLFGTDGARGVAGRDLTAELAVKIGQATAAELGVGAPVAIAQDTRVSSPMLEAALVAGLCAGGARVLRLGMMPTPALAHLIPRLRAAGGIMVSASHNPPEYNGIKLMDPQGRKWPQEFEARVEARVRGELAMSPVGALATGSVRDLSRTGLAHYRRHLIDIFRGRLPRCSVVLDVAHGAAAATAPQVLSALGLAVAVLHGSRDGRRINVGCGATHLEPLKRAVRERRADLGLAFDGDADRLMAVDASGSVADGDAVLYLLAAGMKQRGQLPENLVVMTVMSNLGVERALERQGIRVLRTPVGDRWVAEAMRQQGAAIGGEQSGHIILRQWAETGDGLLTALALLEELGRRGQGLREALAGLERFPQVLKNVTLPMRVADWRRLPGLAAAVALAEAELGAAGRVLVRPSGTEPLLRIMVEGRDAGKISEWANRLAAVAEAALESADAAFR